MKSLAGLAFGLLLPLTATAAAAQSADLAVAVTVSPTTIMPGDTVTYRVQVTNHGPDLATNVSLAGLAPVGFSISSMTPAQGTCNAATRVCMIGSLPHNASLDYLVVGQVDAGAMHGTVMTNTVTVSSDTPDPIPSNNSFFQTITIGAAPPAAVPTLTEWAMILFSVLLAGGAALHLERRRRAA